MDVRLSAHVSRRFPAPSTSSFSAAICALCATSSKPRAHLLPPENGLFPESYFLSHLFAYSMVHASLAVRGPWKEKNVPATDTRYIQMQWATACMYVPRLYNAPKFAVNLQNGTNTYMLYTALQTETRMGIAIYWFCWRGKPRPGRSGLYVPLRANLFAAGWRSSWCRLRMGYTMCWLVHTC